MYSLITLAVIIGILGSVVLNQLRKKARSFPLGLTLVFSLVALVIGGIVTQEILHHFVPTKLISKEYKLSAMRTSSGTYGSFAMGTGTTNSFTKFSLYVVNDDGSVSPLDIAADDRVKIFEDSSLKDTGYLTHTVKKYDYSTPIANWVWQRPNWEELVTEHLRVPAGTLLHTFSAQ